MGKKLGLDKQYSSLLTSVNKNSPSGVLGKAYKSIGTFPKVSGVESSKLLNVGKKVFSKTPIGKAVNLAINVGSGIGIGYSYAKNKFNKKKADFQKGDYSDIKTDKKMGGGMMQGYGAARTSGMGLEDQSLMPGKMTKAALGILAMKKAKDKGAKGPELLSPTAMATKFFSKGGGMDMGKKEEPTQWITKKEKKQNWITKKEK